MYPESLNENQEATLLNHQHKIILRNLQTSRFASVSEMWREIIEKGMVVVT